MKIISLAVSNIMKVTAAFIQPKSDVVVIQGENEAGKSSILNSIIYAFKGDRDLPEMPIKKGAKKGDIVIKLDGDKSLGIPPFTITRTITDKKGYVKIEPESVTAGETPRSFLDKLIGSISFDPLKFINEDPKKQRKTLLQLINIDPDEWDQKEKVAFDKRTEIGRELKVAEAKIKDVVVYEGVGTEEVKVGDLADKLQKAIADNQKLTNRQEANERLKQSAIANKQTIENIKLQIVQLEKEIDRLSRIVADQRTQYNTEKDDLNLSFPADVDVVNKEIAEIESTNSKIRHNLKIGEDRAEKDRIQALYDAADQKVEDVRNDRLCIIQQATMPIPGLTIDDDGILYNDIPLAQCSDGAKLMIGVAVSMALNPKLKVIQIKDGSLIGPKNMEMLKKIVKDNGYQLFLERVNDLEGYNNSGKIGIFIEEGNVIYQNGEPVEKKCAKVEIPKSIKQSTEPKSDQKDEEW